VVGLVGAAFAADAIALGAGPVLLVAAGSMVALTLTLSRREGVARVS
jgi:hypothetical protein